MFWVVTEICSEPNVFRRSKIIKQFIKVARKLSKCLIEYVNYFLVTISIYYDTIK